MYRKYKKVLIIILQEVYFFGEIGMTKTMNPTTTDAENDLISPLHYTYLHFTALKLNDIESSSVILARN